MSSQKHAGTLDYVNDSVTSSRQNAASEEALNAANGSISNPISRDILPSIDLDNPGETEWDGEVDVFVQTPDGDLDAGDSVAVYEIDSDTGKQDDRVLAVYGFEAVEGAELVDTILFRGSDGQVFERAQVQGLDSEGDVQVDRQSILRSPVKFDPQDNGEIEFVFGEGYTGEDDDDVKIKLLGVTVEKRGRRIGNRN